MGWKRHLKFAAAGAAFALIGSTAANAQQAGSCVETEFRSDRGQVYLQAETELLANQNPQAAIAALNKLRAMELNCYEESAAIRLSAAVKLQNEDYRGAISDLEALIAKGYMTGNDLNQTYYNISQLYLQIDNRPKALEYYEKWIAAGGQPDRNQMWTLATLYYQADNKRKSLEYAERVFQIDGPGADRQVYDFLILLYDETGQLGKRAQLLETLLQREPGDKRLWQIITSDYYKSGDERKAFEMQKAMYHAGLLKEENELMTIVNFYNRFDVPFEAAKTLEKEMNAGRIEKTFERMELLANLYQVAREYERAIPVIRAAAEMRDAGNMYFRLGRSYQELGNWPEAEKAMQTALQRGNVKEPGAAWVVIGQARYERKDRAGAREAFREATKFRDGRNGGQGWLDFMASEDATEKALRVFDQQQIVQTLVNEKRGCDRLAVVLSADELPEGCADVVSRLEEQQEKLQEIQGQS